MGGSPRLHSPKSLLPTSQPANPEGQPQTHLSVRGALRVSFRGWGETKEN